MAPKPWASPALDSIQARNDAGQTGPDGVRMLDNKSMKIVSTLILAGGLSGALLATEGAAPSVEFPSQYRSWTRVKSTLIGPDHPHFNSVGGFQHVYANAAAMEGYRTRSFPDGAVIALDWLELETHGAVFSEGNRRQTDVMVRDVQRYVRTGGWGFQRFGPAGGDARIREPAAQQCLACHAARSKDGLVLSRYKD